MESSSMFFGNTCQNGLVPALVRPTLPTVQTSLGMKQFLPFPLETASAVSLFPGFNTMDPVQKAVLHHTLGLPPTAKRKHVSCSVCQLRFNSQSQALAHYKGTKHAKKLKSRDTPKSKLKGSSVAKETTNQDIIKSVYSSGVPNSVDSKDGVLGAAPLPLSPVLRLAAPLTTPAMPVPVPTVSPLVPNSTAATAPESTSAAGGEEKQLKLSSPSEPDPEPEAEPEAESDAETEEEKARRLLYCSLCKVAVNSASQLEAHNSGTKHKTMLEARSGVGSIKSFPRPGVKSKLAAPSKSSTGLQNKTFYCETCDVHVNSETQLKQHISSRRHKDRAAGKPAKPKYSPYTKPQKGQTKQPQIKLTLGKDRPCPPLTAQIIPAHLAAVAAAAAPPLPRHTNHASNHNTTHTLFQTQSLPAALLRPAPGPIRTSHSQVLFAPY
ncbi:LOW QUALITY PROTEIN: zinc finger protein 385D [Cynoglossus semilaevis]|uniref:LOW QUALITY PROTEIN: zinc finger protein 385D n=1 Tax=Cynoglossus semilaevis TaxID=244447 RepID=UPI000D6238B9|nr:LOW QUALITY PROTEIN: zinc finger protein 385D-like [Cynoglossus semilaevis]